MKRSNVRVGRIGWLLAISAGALLFPCKVKADGVAQPKKVHANNAIVVLNQHGRAVPSSLPSATSQIFDVSVGPSGQLVFSPATVNIAVGDTVRWTWAGSGHSEPAAKTVRRTPNIVRLTIQIAAPACFRTLELYINIPSIRPAPTLTTAWRIVREA